MYELIINGIKLPTPSKLTLSDYDISGGKTTRNAKGVMIIEIVRSDVHKLECSWNVLHEEEYLTIRNAISGIYGLSTEYYIPEKGGRGTITTYRGDRSTPVYSYAFDKPIYKDFKLNLIEM